MPETKTTPTVKSNPTANNRLAAALDLVGFDGETLRGAASVLDDMATVKAVDQAQDLSRQELVRDRWTSGDMHRVPGRDELKFGPPQHSSGGGAERMVREYSTPTPQDGLTVESERLQDHLGALRAYMKAMHDDMHALTTVLTTVLEKSIPTETKITMNDELAAFAKMCSSDVGRFLAVASTHLEKAKKAKAKAEEKEGDEKKMCKAEAKEHRRAAAELICKSQFAIQALSGYGLDDITAAKKALDDLFAADPILKAEAFDFGEKQKKKDEKKASKKAVKKAVKKAMAKFALKAAKKGNQADHQDPDTKNQDDSSTSKAGIDPALEAKVAQLAGDMQKALEGTALLQGNVADLMTAISGRPVTTNARTPLELVSSKAATGDTKRPITLVIAENVALSDMERMRANDLAGKLTAVEAGQLAKSVFDRMLDQSPRPVQEIFKAHAAA